MELKVCPLLQQSDTHQSMVKAGDSWTRGYFLQCLGQKCAAFDFKNCLPHCKKFDNCLAICDDLED